MDSSSVLSDEDYDVISNPGSSIADLTHIAAHTVREIPPTEAAREVLSTASLSPADIQSWVRGALDATHARNGGAHPPDHRTVRVFLDGVFDVLTAGHMLQLRQAKLAFPSVYLVVGVFSDESCQQHGTRLRFPHLERCEFLRHCRWVDEVVPDAGWTLTDAFLLAKRIDYVALEEGFSVSPESDKARLKGYDHLKKLGMFFPLCVTSGWCSFFACVTTGRVIPIRRTHGLASAPVVPPKLPRKTSERRPEVLEGDGQVDVTRRKTPLDGQS